jgi:hypothetical protein
MREDKLKAEEFLVRVKTVKEIGAHRHCGDGFRSNSVMSPVSEIHKIAKFTQSIRDIRNVWQPWRHHAKCIAFQIIDWCGLLLGLTYLDASGFRKPVKLMIVVINHFLLLVQLRGLSDDDCHSASKPPS